MMQFKIKQCSLLRLLIILMLFTATGKLTAQRYQTVSGWSDTANSRIEAFLNSTKIIQERKVAVFDCDGTLFGQVPYYLADEAIYAYAQSHYEGKKDTLSRRKMEIINRMTSEDNTSLQYVQDRIDFIAGMTTQQVERMGEDCYEQKYVGKIYPQMRSLLANLKDYGFEIWVLTASPELLYQGFIHKALGIPKNRILGVKSVVRNDTVTSTLVMPVPQDEGKAMALQTFIKARPLLVGGNSRGDMEMMLESVGMQLIINPDAAKREQGAIAGPMKGHSVYDFWKSKPDCVIVSCEDLTKPSSPESTFVTGSLGIKQNKAHPADEFDK